MIVDQAKCVGCGMCIPYCPVRAITIDDKQAVIDMDRCVECGNCHHSDVCRRGALVQQTLSMPRAIRQVFSNPRVKSPNTGIRGRGTQEMKTNDVTLRYTEGVIGFSCELGRPCLGASMQNVEKVAKVIAAHNGKFEEENPSHIVFEEDGSGRVKKEFINERVLSFIIEAIMNPEDFTDTLVELKSVQKELECVFSIDVISRLVDGKIPALKQVEAAGVEVRPNGKTNVGIGRKTC